MPQRLKDNVRQNILASAARVFADKGYRAATLADVAAHAGVTASNIYKYFPNKEGLLESLLTPALAAQLLRLVRARIRELKTRTHWPTGQAGQSLSAHRLLSFWIAHRLTVIILLRGADGTRYCHVRGLLIGEMERLAARFMQQQAGGRSVPAETRFILNRLFTRTVDMIVDVLDRYDERENIERAFAAFWSYQLAGLQAVLQPGNAG